MRNNSLRVRPYFDSNDGGKQRFAVLDSRGRHLEDGFKTRPAALNALIEIKKARKK